jgi:uncharacterized LabA/DUF88 family protein
MVNMKFYKEQRVCILVDVQNMYYSAKNLYNSKVNFDEILNTALNGRTLIRAISYVIKADVRDEKNFHEALEKIGFEVKTKELLVFYGGHKKGDWDIGIAMDAVRAAEKVDVIVVVSGDGDFRELYEYVRGKGCRIEVIAFGKTASSSIKTYVDDFIDMDGKKKFLIPLKDNSRAQNKGEPRPHDGAGSPKPSENRSINQNSTQKSSKRYPGKTGMSGSGRPANKSSNFNAGNRQVKKIASPLNPDRSNVGSVSAGSDEFDITSVNNEQPKEGQIPSLAKQPRQVMVAPGAVKNIVLEPGKKNESLKRSKKQA